MNYFHVFLPQNVSPVTQGALQAETVPCARRINTLWATRCHADRARQDPLHPATQELLASQAVVSKAGVALKTYPESDGTLKSVSWTFEQPSSKTDRSYIGVLRPLFVFCALHYGTKQC